MQSPSKNDDTPLANEIEILFPEIIDEKIRTIEFLNAARGVVRIVEKLGKVFAPVKYDIQGNIDKLTARYVTDKVKNTMLQDMILLEKDENTTNTKLIAADALLWLTRGLHMILLFFEKIVEDAKTGTPTDDLVAFLKKSYKEALEPYHGWMAQQLFDLLSRMVPTRPQFLRAINGKKIDEDSSLINDMEIYLTRLRTNVSAIQLFYKTHNLDTLV
ncbi:pleckstrin homology domain-containing family A member 8 [Ceratina calcarata]|uniref:Pleckstrin homology domain-containing family A member 8 n=1 Tax=Ceratina calcarata TaxID=156304 RepID=A0AAJ7WFE5_9HYME|nr:pleckstrin homology domain-containing family A member 8 [Ceratina calcarata]XP_026674422.1 pleckstrin homology domain-containing family A member 8 [Ceratina calcarata]XP_026674423.1 pleckstrin homology domain-containing family A member 8 [Ceratina calcarata]